MSHVVHYGSSVFEGIRCYALPSGPAIFRAQEHMQRLLDSAKIYRIDLEYTREQLISAMTELVAANRSWPCYIRPIVFARLWAGGRESVWIADRGLHRELSVGQVYGSRQR